MAICLYEILVFYVRTQIQASNKVSTSDTDNLPSRDSPDYDRIYKIRPFIDKLLTSFKTNYKPSQYLSIDESMISFKGRLLWIQYMPQNYKMVHESLGTR